MSPLIRGAALGVVSLLSSTAYAQNAAIFAAAPSLDEAQAVQGIIFGNQEFNEVDLFDAQASTPTLAELQPYFSVFVYSTRNAGFEDPVAFGDVLADYVDQGGGVVVAGSALNVLGSTALRGRLVDEPYLPYDLSQGGGIIEVPDLALDRLDLEEWATYGFNDFACGTCAHVQGLRVRPGAINLAEYVDPTGAREALSAANTPASTVGTPGRVVALNFPPLPGAWDPATDGDRAMTQGMLYSARLERPASTLYNTFVDQDFNCNAIDGVDEVLVDIFDPLCAMNVDENGEIIESADYYFDYLSYGCQYFTLPLDSDFIFSGIDPTPIFEGLGGHEDPMLNPFSFPRPDGGASPYARMSGCDNCPADFNLDQADVDADATGDLCDNCLYISNQDQINGQECPELMGMEDGDLWGSACDNCPCVPNPLQVNTDGDVHGDECDNCIETPNDDQTDLDRDGVGEACDNCSYFNPVLEDRPLDAMENPEQEDQDEDTVGDTCDNCLTTPNTNQSNVDEDALGDLCDLCPQVAEETLGDDLLDMDMDGVGDSCDNCLITPNPREGDIFSPQPDADFDQIGDACDNCPINSNNNQSDGDDDGAGDACDVCPMIPDPAQADSDGDGVGDLCDNCPFAANPGQEDDEGDGFGDACDVCPGEFPLPEFPSNLDSDGDGIGDQCDNCPATPNADQSDEDGDGLGDICDIFAVRGGGSTTSNTGCNSQGGGIAWFGLGLGLLTLRRRRS